MYFSADDPFLLGCFIMDESDLPTKSDAETYFGKVFKQIICGNYYWTSHIVGTNGQLKSQSYNKDPKLPE